MLTIQITCACGHYGTVTDGRAMERWKKTDKPRFRCSRSGASGQTKARLAWQANLNQMEGAYAGGLRDLEE